MMVPALPTAGVVQTQGSKCSSDTNVILAGNVSVSVVGPGTSVSPTLLTLNV